MVKQLTFDLALPPPTFAREDLVVADGNREALAWLDRWPDWPATGNCMLAPASCSIWWRAWSVQVRRPAGWSPRSIGARSANGARSTDDWRPTYWQNSRGVHHEIVPCIGFGCPVRVVRIGAADG